LAPTGRRILGGWAFSMPPPCGQVKWSLASQVISATGKRGSRGIPREAMGCPHYHHPDDCGRGSRERQGGDGGFGDVVGVISSAAPISRSLIGVSSSVELVLVDDGTLEVRNGQNGSQQYWPRMLARSTAQTSVKRFVNCA
jgi:hypothetical protein